MQQEKTALFPAAWRYQSSIGLFEIFFVVDELYDLWLADEPVGLFDSPEKAAEAVFHKNTGNEIWDDLLTEFGPVDLSKWEHYQ